MITEQEAQFYLNKLNSLKRKAKKTGILKDQREAQQFENFCLEKFKILVINKTYKYKKYSNYEDLIQEGMLGLVMALETYDPKKSPFLYWGVKYIDTRIARGANLHSAIRIPLKVVGEMKPIKENKVPEIISLALCPEKMMVNKEIKNIIINILSCLSKKERKIIYLYFGIENNDPQSINKICQKMHLSRMVVKKIIQKSLLELKDLIII